MDTEALLSPDSASHLGRSRARVLDLLCAADASMGVQEVADQVDLHPNTARFHLDGLVAAGLAVREPRPRAVPGRPSMAYRATGRGPAGERRYRLLAEMLASLVRGMMPEPGRAAAAAGREWGAYLAERPPPYQHPTADDAIAGLARILGELGFAPAAEGGDGHYQVRLLDCPFREVAQSNQDIVCALHHGLVNGALEQMRAPVRSDRLEPFAGPGLCIVHLSDVGKAGPGAEPGTG